MRPPQGVLTTKSLERHAASKSAIAAAKTLRTKRNAHLRQQAGFHSEPKLLHAKPLKAFICSAQTNCGSFGTFSNQVSPFRSRQIIADFQAPSWEGASAKV